MDDVFIRLAKLPDSAKGFVLDDENGDFNVYINGNLCYEMQLEAAKHELEHIKRNHLFKEVSVGVAEGEAGS
jgi:hypothetical protein